MNIDRINVTVRLAEERGEGIVALYATPNSFLLNKICLNQTGDNSNMTRTHSTGIMVMR